VTGESAYHTYNEILAQPKAWQAAIDRSGGLSLPPADSYSQALFTGCGSTYYLSLAAAALYQELTGKAGRAIPAGELLLNPHTVLTGESTLLVAISRSGTTTETLRAVENFKAAKRGPVLAITTHNSSLSALAESSLVISEGQEKSVAQTRSFASMYLAAVSLCLLAAERGDLLRVMPGLPAIGERLLQQYDALARDIGGNLAFERFTFLGNAILYGLAREASLKVTEMTLTQSDAFHFLEFRHGPMSMVDARTVIVGMLSEKNAAQEEAVLNEMREKGGTILSLGEGGADVAFASGMPECLRGVLYLPVLQMMAFYRSLAKGLNPDRPKNLEAVVTLDL
jgi:glucosamine--fructose-6-phosphate aminotransferase (isomerizing)